MVWGVMFSPSFVVFAGVSLLGMMLVLVSSGLLGMWLCLELGFFGFIPILNGKTVGENESAVKYFIIQSVGSGVLLVSFIFMSADYFVMMSDSGLSSVVGGFMVAGFMVKLGVFPMHFWFPSVMGSASWFSCFWLSVVQKLGPFWALGGLGLGGLLLSGAVVMLVLTSVVGGFGGLAQVQFRPLLAYSSLGQTGWMGLVVFSSVELFVYYFLTYSAILLGLLWGLNVINSYGVGDMPGWSLGKGFVFWVFSCSFFISLSGLPPLAGSAMKLMGVLVIVMSHPLYLGVLVGTSMVSLYYYLSMFISSVVCVGGSGFSVYDGLLVDRGLALGLVFLAGFNWVSGFPLFLVCGMLVL